MHVCLLALQRKIEMLLKAKDVAQVYHVKVKQWLLSKETTNRLLFCQPIEIFGFQLAAAVIFF